MTEPLRGGAGRDTLTLTAIASQDEQDRALLTKAQEIVELFQRAVKLGYSITLPPEQMQLLVAICERAYLLNAALAAKAPQGVPRHCNACGKIETGWRYDRCPNCGELAPRLPVPVPVSDDTIHHGMVPPLAVSKLADEVNQCLQIILTNTGNIKDDRDWPILEECIAIEDAVDRASKATWAALREAAAPKPAPPASDDKLADLREEMNGMVDASWKDACLGWQRDICAAVGLEPVKKSVLLATLRDRHASAERVRLTGTQVLAAMNEVCDMHGIGRDFPTTWVDSNIDFNQLADALNRRALPPSTGEKSQ